MLCVNEYFTQYIFQKENFRYDNKKDKRKRRWRTFMLDFRKKDSKELIKQVAKIHGCSVKEVRE